MKEWRKKKKGWKGWSSAWWFPWRFGEGRGGGESGEGWSSAWWIMWLSERVRSKIRRTQP